jgi:hypothetical protein
MELSAAIPLVEAVGNFQSEQFMADAVRTVLAALLESQRERDAALARAEQLQRAWDSAQQVLADKEELYIEQFERAEKAEAVRDDAIKAVSAFHAHHPGLSLAENIWYMVKNLEAIASERDVEQSRAERAESERDNLRVAALALLEGWDARRAKDAGKLGMGSNIATERAGAYTSTYYWEQLRKALDDLSDAPPAARAPEPEKHVEVGAMGPTKRCSCGGDWPCEEAPCE